MNWPIRDAGVDDLPFLRAMLYEAAYWRPDGPRPPMASALEQPHLAKLLVDWGRRRGDAGVIAVSTEGAPVGAAWYRFWTDEDHSFGYVDANTPELGIAVVREYRGQGVGRAMLRALLQHAEEFGLSKVSLSVEQDNPAQHLYRSAGFRTVGTLGSAYTMVANLGSETT